jgi:hypothetical protein
MLPGMARSDARRPGWPDGARVKLHHVIERDGLAYGAWWDEGLVILDVADPTEPRLVSQLRFGHDVSRASHTACPLPGRDLLVMTEERWDDGCVGVTPNARIVDVSDPRRPAVRSVFPLPEGDFCRLGGRFGPHNVHEPRPGSLIDGTTVYMTYFNAGLRVYDVSDPATPVEIAWYVPDPPPGRPTIQLNDVVVGADGLIYVTDRDAGGLYILELDGAADRARPRTARAGSR